MDKGVIMDKQKAWEFLNSRCATVILMACKFMENDIPFIYLSELNRTGILTDEQHTELKEYVKFCLNEHGNVNA